MQDARPGPSRALLWLEWTLIFIAMPVVMWLFTPRLHRFLFFAPPVVYALIVHLRARVARPPATWPWQKPAIRLAVAIPILIAAVLILVPERWLDFPHRRPGIWAVVMALYPFLSALPQEFLYRRFFFWRYADLFGAGSGALVANALAFTWLHLMYANATATILSFLGGLIFASTYLRSGNLVLVWIEHSLYGQILFTIGLGRFFYKGPL